MGKTTSFNTRHNDHKMLMFLKEHCEDTASVLCMGELWGEYRVQNDVNTLKTTIWKRFRYHVAPTIQNMSTIPLLTRVKMLFASSTPIDEGFLDQLREIANVEVDSSMRIIEFHQEGGIHLSGQHKRKELKRNPVPQDGNPTTANPLRRPHSAIASSDSDSGESPTKKAYELLVRLCEENRETAQNLPIPDPSIELIQPQEVPGPTDPEEVVNVKQENVSRASSVASSDSVTSCDESQFNNLMETLAKGIETNEQLMQQLKDKDAQLSQQLSQTSELTETNAVSAKEVLKLLKIMLLSLENPELSGVFNKVKTAIEKLGSGDEAVSVDTIKFGLEVVLALVSH